MNEDERWHHGNAIEASRIKENLERGGKGIVRKVRESGNNGVVEATRIDSSKEGVMGNVRYTETGRSRTEKHPLELSMWRSLGP